MIVYEEDAGLRNRRVDFILSEKFTAEEVAESIDKLVAMLQAAREQAVANNWPKPRYFRLYNLEGNHLPPGMLTKAMAMMAKLFTVMDLLSPALFICSKHSFVLTMGKAFAVLSRSDSNVVLDCAVAYARRERMLAVGQQPPPSTSTE